MKLLPTHDKGHEVRGGTSMFIADLARSLREHRLEIAVSSWLQGSLADELNNASVPVEVAEAVPPRHHSAAVSARKTVRDGGTPSYAGLYSGKNGLCTFSSAMVVSGP